MADITVQMRRAVREQWAVIQNQRIMDMFAVGEAGAAMPVRAVRQMLNRKRRRQASALSATADLAAAAAIAEAPHYHQNHAFNVEVNG